MEKLSESAKHTEKVLQELAEPYKKLTQHELKTTRRHYGRDFKEHPTKATAARKKNSPDVKKQEKAILYEAGLSTTSDGKKVFSNCDNNYELSEFHRQDAQIFMNTIVRASGITPEMLVEEIAKIAFNKDGMPFAADGDHQGKLDITAKDKLKALDMLAKWVGLYEKDNAQKSPTAQMLQITFVGSDVREEVERRNARKQALKDETIWDAETSEKMGNALANALKDGDSDEHKD